MADHVAPGGNLHKVSAFFHAFRAAFRPFRPPSAPSGAKRPFSAFLSALPPTSRRRYRVPLLADTVPSPSRNRPFRALPRLRPPTP